MNHLCKTDRRFLIARDALRGALIVAAVAGIALATPRGLQAQGAGPLSSPLPTPNPKAQITIRVSIDPYYSIQNFRFNGSFGLFVLDTDYDGDPYSSSQTFTVNPGTYKVEEWTPTGWYVSSYSCGLSGPYASAAAASTNSAAATTSGNPGVIINVKAGDRITCGFSNVQYSQIEIRKWNDINADGLRTGNEPYLAGWNFVLFDNYTGQAITQGSTDAAGRLMMNSVRPGYYQVCEQLVAPWRNSRPATTGVQGQPCYYFFISAGMKNEIWFGNYQPTKITASVVPKANTSIDQKQLPATDN